MTQAKDGDKVTIHYTGRLTDGTVFDSSDGRDPLPFTIGAGQVIPGFEEAVLGMACGENKTVTIPVDKAYGPRNEEMVLTFPRDQVPADIKPEVGMQLQLMNEQNQPLMVRITEVTEESVSLDANPPLAGQELTFDIELVSLDG
ncbi:FKBP-type peptidyl-prolyl cis-trans isomerase [Desulfogranum mediterraneum]|uniref:FKBP-type peptidyl-prolyl cis-trans isomerase n=1 Tax=Desulfogranum mediterraneum TaxID=160661 RepID=UPI0003FFE692|nr:peptidylprolyl isomerase [Desulfogranum mediterraneum]